MVASNQRTFSAGLQDRRLPSERSRSKPSTWLPKVPARWWFLPCTSLAIAPATVTKRVPGVTGRNQPCGTPKARMSASSSPGIALQHAGGGVEVADAALATHIQQAAARVQVAVAVAAAVAVGQPAADRPGVGCGQQPGHRRGVRRQLDHRVRRAQHAPP